MRKPTLVFVGNSFEEIRRLDNAAYRTTRAVEVAVTTAILRAEQLTAPRASALEEVARLDSRSAQREAWEADSTISEFFGPAPRISTEIRLTAWRLRRVHWRLSERRLRIRMLPQARGATTQTVAHNYGGGFSPNTFSLLPMWFTAKDDDFDDTTYRASIMAHELFHEWYADFKVTVGGQRRYAYGRSDARLLAERHPARARRNPENYQWYLLANSRSPRVQPGPEASLHRAFKDARVVAATERLVRQVHGATAGARS